jgi:hypothetical protein
MVICEQDSYATTQVNGHTFNTFKKGKKVTIAGKKSLKISIFNEAMRRIFWGFCRNRFLMSPLHYSSSRSVFRLEFSEIFVIEKRLPLTVFLIMTCVVHPDQSESETFYLGFFTCKKSKQSLIICTISHEHSLFPCKRLVLPNARDI